MIIAIMQSHTVFYYATPVLLILIGIESVNVIKENRDNKKDIWLTLGLVLGRLPVSFLTNGVALYVYTLAYQSRLFVIRVSCWWGWLLCFIFDDLSFYWFHRYSHQIRFLWASHKVHHSSRKFTFISGLRVPWTSDLTGNFLFWSWIPLTGINPAMLLWMKSANVFYQFWMHTETIRKLPKWFEAVFNTPSHHRVHHSSDVKYLDKNFGGTLIIWDKLFETYQKEIFKPKYGLTENIESFNPFTIAFHEWKNIFRDIKRARNKKDKLTYLLNPPGWSHDGVTKTAKQLQLQCNKVEPGKPGNSFVGSGFHGRKRKDEE